MTAVVRTRRLRKRAEQANVARTLCALLRCGSLVVAIPADMIVSIALSSDVSVTEHANGTRVTAGALSAPAWELASVLELEAASETWVFLKLAGNDGPMMIALGCGECVSVTKLVDPDPLPRGVFHGNADAILGAFEVEASLVERGCGIVGVWFDPQRMLGRDEVARATRGVT